MSMFLLTYLLFEIAVGNANGNFAALLDNGLQCLWSMLQWSVLLAKLFPAYFMLEADSAYCVIECVASNVLSEKSDSDILIAFLNIELETTYLLFHSHGNNTHCGGL